MATADLIRQKIASVRYWHHRIPLGHGIVTPGASDSLSLLRSLDFPDDLSGKRALDIGARDGHFSFELERRGAKVLAVDYVPSTETGFAVAKELLGSNVDYLHRNLFELDVKELGSFDIVLFLGVLYHLRDPMGSLDLIRSFTEGSLYVESHVCDEELPCSQPIMRFYPRDALGGDFTNYWGPNVACLRAMLEEANFRVERYSRSGPRAVFVCTAGQDKQMDYYSALAAGKVETPRA